MTALLIPLMAAALLPGIAAFALARVFGGWAGTLVVLVALGIAAILLLQGLGIVAPGDVSLVTGDIALEEYGMGHRTQWVTLIFAALPAVLSAMIGRSAGLRARNRTEGGRA